MNGSERIGTGKNATEGHEDDVDLRMLSGPLHSSFLKVLEVSLKEAYP